MNNFVVVDKLVKMYGDFCAVDNLSLQIEEGEIYGLLGPNGAGKSTTLSVITTLNSFEKGTVTIGGYDVVKNCNEVRRIVGMVPQEISVYKHLTAYENVKFFAKLYGLKGVELESSIDDALQFVGLQDKRKMKPRQMSGGMQRRLNIACGIVHRPKLIVMDEPTVGVDAQSREHILNSIRILKEKGATVIYTSHYMQEVEEICDHIAIVDHGRLIASGTEKDLVSLVTEVKPFRVDTRIPASFNTDELTRKLKTLPDVANVTYKENEIHIDLSIRNNNVLPVIQTISDAGLTIINTTSENPNLDTTFLCLTGKELR